MISIASLAAGYQIDRCVLPQASVHDKYYFFRTVRLLLPPYSLSHVSFLQHITVHNFTTPPPSYQLSSFFIGLAFRLKCSVVYPSLIEDINLPLRPLLGSSIHLSTLILPTLSKFYQRLASSSATILNGLSQHSTSNLYQRYSSLKFGQPHVEYSPILNCESA